MLVVVCGRPCVGKTTTCAALARFLQENGKTVIIVNEESVGIVHTDGYNGESVSEAVESWRRALLALLKPAACAL